MKESVNGKVPRESLKRPMDVIGQSLPPVETKLADKSISNSPSSTLFD